MKKPHAEPAYDFALDRVRILLHTMAELAESMLKDSLQALAQRDATAARHIAMRDAEVNALEVEIDERCLKLLACWQPVASDLRFVGATLKLVTDLERIGDQCVNICDRAVDLAGHRSQPPPDLDVLIGAVPALLHDALNAWETEDATWAADLLERGRRIGTLVHEIVRSCLEARDEDRIAALHWHDVANHLERIGAHANNVAELTVFLVRGQDVRHTGHLPETPKSLS